MLEETNVQRADTLNQNLSTLFGGPAPPKFAIGPKQNVR